jgi:acetoin utilization deacetylase AcuC-like enzyme
MTTGSKVGLILDAVFETHDTGPGHPEAPIRLAQIRSLLSEDVVSSCVLVQPEPVAPSLLLNVHDAEHVQAVDLACRSAPQNLDGGDTVVSRESGDVARLAAGSVIRLCRMVLSGELDCGFAAVRPPGHHAERNRAMGFCLFNNVAVAAAWLLEQSGIGKVLIVDWDVHHGNGTQHIFEESESVLYFSIHQSPHWPGTGSRREIGRGEGTGTTWNRPLPAGSDDTEFLELLREDLSEAAGSFQPDFVLISAGFDAHRQDPLGGLQVSTAGFREATTLVREIAAHHAEGRLVSVLEGGYDLTALPASVEAHLEALLD